MEGAAGSAAESCSCYARCKDDCQIVDAVAQLRRIDGFAFARDEGESEMRPLVRFFLIFDDGGADHVRMRQNIRAVEGF